MKKRLLAMLLAAIMTASMVACAGDTTDDTADTAAVGETAAVETEAAWEFPDVDYAGGEYRILNFDQLWNMYIHMDMPEQTGEILNDAVYNRNRKVEDELNCVIAEKEIVNTTDVPADLTTIAKNTIMAGADDYDIMCLAISANATLVTEGCLMDLMPIEEFNFEETWWDHDIIDAVTLDGKLYFTSGSANLMAFDSMWGLFFNENIMADHNLDKPYDLVREGKWTLDKLTEYCTAVANLNGDTSFAWDMNGNAFYGISAHFAAITDKLLYASGCRYVETQDNGDILFTLESEHFYNVIDKLGTLMNPQSGLMLRADTTDFSAEKGGYMHVFTTLRSLFLTAEIKAAQLMRDMEDTYGLVPMPKADESQEDYMTTIVNQMFYWGIPATNSKLDMTATVSEVLTHESYETVVPVYYNSVVEHKGLRNEDSIEMLEIMRRTKGVDISVIFNWNSSLSTSLYTMLFEGNSQVASTVASAKKGIETSVAEFKEFLAE